MKRRHPPFNVELVEMAPGQTFRFRSVGKGAGLGSLLVDGRLASVENVTSEEALDTPWTAGTHSLWTDFGPGKFAIEAGPDGASWVCMSQNGSGSWPIEHVTVDGSYTLPRGWGFVVASGEVEASGETLGQLDYFAPRLTVDVEVTGSAELLIAWLTVE